MSWIAAATVTSAGIGYANSERDRAANKAIQRDRAPAPELNFSGGIEGMDTSFLTRNEPGISSIATKQFDLGKAMLQPQFAESKSAVASALSSRKMGRTSTFANAMTSLAGKEDTAYSSLLSNILKTEQEDSLQRTQLRASMEQSGLSSRTSRYGSYMSYLGQAEAADATRSSASSKASGQLTGDLLSAAAKFIK
jgi:hypothetical protein